MVALKLILQSLAGVVALGGAVGGTVVLSRNPQSEENQIPQTKTIEVELDANDETAKAFYLVSASISISDQPPSKDLFDGTDLTQKNYQCVNSSQTSDDSEETITKDSSCILYSLKNTTNTSLKISEIQTWTQSKESTIATQVIKKINIKEKKFFLLEANAKLNKSEINNSETLIYLTKKDTTDYFSQSNYYVMLQIHAKISLNELTVSTDTIIAKGTGETQVSNTPSTVSSATYECSFKTSEPKKDCMLSKLSNYSSDNSFNFANLPIKNRSERINVDYNNYYLIKTEQIIQHELKNLKNSTATYIETKPQNSRTATTLSIEAAVFAKFNNDETRLTELIILDQ